MGVGGEGLKAADRDGELLRAVEHGGARRSTAGLVCDKAGVETVFSQGLVLHVMVAACLVSVWLLVCKCQLWGLSPRAVSCSGS